MYIIKNALRCIVRSKGRNILIGIIALVIAVSACIGLSIRQAAESAKASALEGMSVTANINYDWMSSFDGLKTPFEGGTKIDKDAINNMLGKDNSLSLDEYKTYASASTVNGFYYTLTAYFNGSEDFEKIEVSYGGGGNSFPGMGGGFPGMGGGSSFPGMGGGSRGTSGDFTVIGFSSRAAMTEFTSGNATLTDDSVMFDEDTSALVCIISEELASYNELSIGDSIVITNPVAEDESYTLEIVGLYESTQSSGLSNNVYVSVNTLSAILEASAEVSTEYTTSSGSTAETKVTGSYIATYLFADVEDFEVFCNEVYTLGLGEAYTVESTDLQAFEERLNPLKTLGNMAGWFLVVILIIGGIILVVLNIFNVRERKYEVGVLTAMGMKKWKVAAQFMCEILVVTMIAVVIGAGIGAVSSVPVTNALLAEQIESQSNAKDPFNQGFDPSGMRPGGNMPSGNMPGGNMLGGNMPSGGKNPLGDMFGGAVDYITEVNSAMNLTVVLQMIGVGLLLTMIASAASVLFIMRYDPLKILANRD